MSKAKVTIKQAYSVRLYLPGACDRTAASAYLRKLAGGYTATTGVGIWDGPSCTIAEKVVVLDANIVGISRAVLREHVKAIGELFLADNPDELCFHARFAGDIINIERTVH